MPRILIADQDDTVRSSVGAMLRARPEAVVVEAPNKTELIAQVRSGAYDLVIVELSLCPGAETSLIQRIRNASPHTSVLVFTELDECGFGVSAIQAGAKGYLTKNASYAQLLAVVDRITQGRIYISQVSAEELVVAAREGHLKAPHDNLTKGERQVFSMLVSEWSLCTIASTLGLRLETVGEYRARILSKLRCRNLEALGEYALAQGLRDECRASCDMM